MEAFSRALSYHALVDALDVALDVSEPSGFLGDQPIHVAGRLEVGLSKSLILGLVTRTSRAGDLRDHRRPGVTLEPRSLNTLLDDPYPHIRFGDARSKVDELAEDDSFDGVPFGCDCHWVASRNSVDDELDLF